MRSRTVATPCLKPTEPEHAAAATALGKDQGPAPGGLACRRPERERRKRSASGVSFRLPCKAAAARDCRHARGTALSSCAPASRPELASGLHARFRERASICLAAARRPRASPCCESNHLLRSLIVCALAPCSVKCSVLRAVSNCCGSGSPLRSPAPRSRPADRSSLPLSRIIRPEVAATPHRHAAIPIPCRRSTASARRPKQGDRDDRMPRAQHRHQPQQPVRGRGPRIESPAITYPELHRVCKLLWMFTAGRT
jgi:hypothetical protein